MQRADAQGFACFRAFLGGVAAALGLLSWWMTRGVQARRDAGGTDPAQD